MVKPSQSQKPQSEEGYSIANEELNEDLILHCWQLVREQVKGLAALEKYPPFEDNDTHGKISYAFKKEGVINEVAISNLEEFINSDFDETFERIRAPAPQIHFDSKDLLNYVKHNEESKEKDHFQ